MIATLNLNNALAKLKKKEDLMDHLRDKEVAKEVVMIHQLIHVLTTQLVENVVLMIVFGILMVEEYVKVMVLLETNSLGIY